MASKRHASPQINHMFIYIFISLSLPTMHEGVAKAYDSTRSFPNDDGGRKLTREYNLRQGALRGLIVKPSRMYDLQNVEMFLGIPYAAPPTGHLRFMPPVSAAPWSGVKMATRFAPVCPQAFPTIKKGNPPSRERQHYLSRLKPFLKNESEDCLYLNIYVPYREQKSKKFPVLVFIHGDSFEWSSGNPYEGRILASYGNIMVITVNYRLGILGFMKPSLTEHVYGNNGLLDQLAALQWIKDNIEDLNGDPRSVTLMGHGTGAACVNFLMLSPISNGLFHRAVLMSGSALSNWAMTKDPTQYTLQVAQSLGCNPTAKDMMACLQKKPLSEIKKVQILAREFESPLALVVAGSFIPNEPAKIMDAFPNLLSKYQLLSGVTELESYHDFGVIELDHGVLETQRDEFINKLCKVIFDGAEDVALREVLKQYSPSSIDPQRWNVETNRDVILSLFSDARTLAPMIRFANYQSRSNRQSYFYVFGHNSISTDYASLNKSVNGEELPYVLGIPLGGANTHFHSEYTPKEKLLSEVVMRLWTNFVKIGTPNTQSLNEYYTLDQKQWSKYNVDWPEYNVEHQSYLKLDIPPFISSLYRSNFTNFWIHSLPSKMSRYIVDPLFEYTPARTTAKSKSDHREQDSVGKSWPSKVVETQQHNIHSTYGNIRPYSQPVSRNDRDYIYREIQAIKNPSRPVPPEFREKTFLQRPATTTKTLTSLPTSNKTSGASITMIVCLSALFIFVNIGICVTIYIKKRKSHNRNRLHQNTHSRAEVGDVDLIGLKNKDDKGALQTFKNGCSAIKTISINKVRSSSLKKKKAKFEPCKSPKSDDSGGFRERFQLRRHLSTSTLDAHTKVRDWIANEVMHRCSPSILRKSNVDLNKDIKIGTGKIYTRSEEILSNAKVINDSVPGNSNSLSSHKKFSSDRKRNSEKTISTSALGSHSSIGSNKQLTSGHKQSKKSNDSLKSKGTDSVRSKKVSVAVDATPAARTNSILKQEPIEFSKSLDFEDHGHSKTNITLTRSKTEENFEIKNRTINETEIKDKVYTNEITMSLGEIHSPLKISHKHSTSDPVTEVNYDKLVNDKKESSIADLLPPVIFRNDINVTSKDDKDLIQPLTAAEALLTIKRRNFPKVLPDLPKYEKRLSLQPNSLQTFRNFCGPSEILEHYKTPPVPPPRTITLEKRLDFNNSKLLLSFDNSKSRNILDNESKNKNYQNIEHIYQCRHPTSNTVLETHSYDAEKIEDTQKLHSKERKYPKVIIASSNITAEPTILLKQYSGPTELPSNVPRIRLPEDFHSQATGSVTSFSSFYSDDDMYDINDIDDVAEDKLLQEIVGGVDSPTNMDVIFDSKGPETIFEKKLEVIPVKVNPGYFPPKSAEDYICISDLLLPDVSTLEKTAQIKPNLGLSKLQEKSQSIQKPLEKSVKVKPKKSIRPGNILTRGSKNRKNTSFDNNRSDTNELEHSNSGSSNDTVTSTGTVKKVETN